MIKQNFIQSVAIGMNENNSEFIFLCFACAVSFAVATSRDSIFIIDSSTIEFLAQRTEQLNKYRTGWGWSEAINIIEGLIAGIGTYLFKPTAELFIKEIVKPYFSKIGKQITTKIKIRK